MQGFRWQLREGFIGGCKDGKRAVSLERFHQSRGFDSGHQGAEIFRPDRQLYQVFWYHHGVDHVDDAVGADDVGGHDGRTVDGHGALVDGDVQVHSHGQVLAKLTTNQCFGEMAILDAEPRSADVTALSAITLLRIQRDDFHEILAEKPEISLGIIQVLTNRLREANRK